MIAHVTPLRRLPSGLDFFDYYLTPEQERAVQIGQLVIIPFKQQQLSGVITGLSPTADPLPTKTINTFLDFSLTEHQVSLARYLASFYRLSLATTLALFVPTVAKRSIAITERVASTALPFKLSSLKEVSDNGWLMYQGWPALLSYLRVVLQKKQDGQTLIVCPEFYQQQVLIQLLSSLKLDKKSVWLPGRSQKNNYAAAWRASQTADYIVGGFQSLWLPFSHLQQAIIIEADNLQFQRAEQTPRIHLSDILKEWQQQYDCQLLVTTVSPTVQLYHALKPLALPEITLRATPPPERTIVDMRAERQIKNFDFLSEAAKTIIAESTTPVLLYLNQHGSETLLTCQHCHWLAPCPQCDKALTFDKQTQKLQCLSCGHQREPIPRCLNCGSERLKLSASGQKKLHKELVRLFPTKKIVIYKSGASLTDIDKNALVIATSAILSSLNHFQQTIMVSADNELQRPDFQAADQLRRTIFKLQQLSHSVLIQTFNPEHYVFTTLDSFGSFYQQELKFRHDFNYPPSASSYKIIFRNAKKTKTKDTPTKEVVLEFLQTEKITPKQYLIYDKHIIVRGPIDTSLIDKLHKKFNNKLIIEINPYQWL